MSRLSIQLKKHSYITDQSGYETKIYIRRKYEREFNKVLHIYIRTLR